MKRIYLIAMAVVASVTAAAVSPAAAPLFHNGVAKASNSKMCTFNFKAYISGDGQVICQGAGTTCCTQPGQ